MFRSSVESMINQTSGPFLEVGGPTQHLTGGVSIDFSKIEKPLIVSNVAPGFVYEGYWSNRILGGIYATETPRGIKKMLYGFRGEARLQRDFEYVRHTLDLRADATALPIAAAGLGALYASGLPPQVEALFVASEAPRTLEPGGVLVAEGMERDTAEHIQPYFDVIRSRKAGEAALDMVLRRNDIPYLKP